MTPGVPLIRLSPLRTSFLPTNDPRLTTNPANFAKNDAAMNRITRWVATCVVASSGALSNLGAPSPSPLPTGYAVHEWGTFTSIQGSDGTPIPWNPFVTSDLPPFVFTRRQPTLNTERFQPHALQFSLGELKSSEAWLQRMETPVLYFYSDPGQLVDVEVRFPKGRLTEWFPQVTAFGPASGIEPLVPSTNHSLLRWSRTRILPRAASTDLALVDSLPVTPLPSHYYPARQTRANLVEATRPFAQEQLPQRDRFLFYRGAGNFPTPLHASLPEEGLLRVANQGHETLGPLFFVQVRDGRLHGRPLGTLAPSATVEFPVPGPGTVGPATAEPASVADTDTAPLADALRRALLEAGLFQEEADAMIATWTDSWFQEEGTRVLYLLPATWTENVLPLALDPAPRERVRVMVGRADLLSPSLERRVAGLAQAYFQGDSRASLEGLRQLRLGRFLEPALTRAAQLLGSSAVAAAFGCGAPVKVSERTDLALPELESSFVAEDWGGRMATLKQTLRSVQP